MVNNDYKKLSRIANLKRRGAGMQGYLVSTAVLPVGVGKQLFDYTGIPEGLGLLEADGVELVFLPEWNTSGPPLTPTSADWARTPKISVRDLAEYILSNGIDAR